MSYIKIYITIYITKMNNLHLVTSFDFKNFKEYHSSWCWVNDVPFWCKNIEEAKPLNLLPFHFDNFPMRSESTNGFFVSAM